MQLGRARVLSLLLSLLPVLLSMLFAASAAADVAPRRPRAERLISVTASVPKGRAFVLAPTSRGAMVIEPGTPQRLHPHPMGGDMRLHLVSEQVAGEIDTLRAHNKRFEIAELVTSGEACRGGSIAADASAQVDARWLATVSFEGASCVVKAERVARFEADATPPAQPTKASPASATPERPAAPERPSSADKSEPVEERGAGLCRVDGSRDGVGVVALLGLMLLAGRGGGARARRRPA